MRISRYALTAAAAAVAMFEPIPFDKARAQETVHLTQLAPRMDDHVRVGVSVTSGAARPLEIVAVRCGALDANGNLVATGLALFQNLMPGETAYDFANFRDLTSINFEFKCRVDRATKREPLLKNRPAPDRPD